MKNLTPEPSQPRPTDASAPRPPRRRRRLNLAKAGVAIAAAAILGLGGFAMNADAQWQKPMPLRHKVVTTVSALPSLPSVPATVNDGNNGQVTFASTTAYTGEPIVVSANASVPVRVGLPSSATATTAGETVEIGPTPGGLGWRSVAGTALTSMAPLASGWDGYASWFVRFDAPGTYSLPVTLGTLTKTVVIHVIALPPAAHLSVETTPANRPSLTVSNPGTTPIRVTASGLPSVLTPGQSVVVYPGAAYDVLQPQTSYTNQLGFSIQQVIGSVHFAGTYPVAHRIAYHPPHPAFALPLWWLIALILAALTLIASTVAGLRGGGKPQRDQSA